MEGPPYPRYDTMDLPARLFSDVPSVQRAGVPRDCERLQLGQPGGEFGGRLSAYRQDTSAAT